MKKQNVIIEDFLKNVQSFVCFIKRIVDLIVQQNTSRMHYY